MRLKYNLTRAQAKEQGYIIDDHCYPPVAYKEPRRSPTDWCKTSTEREEELELENAYQHDLLRDCQIALAGAPETFALRPNICGVSFMMKLYQRLRRITDEQRT